MSYKLVCVCSTICTVINVHVLYQVTYLSSFKSTDAGSTIYRQLREVFCKNLKSEVNWSGRGRTGRRGKATIKKWRVGGGRLGDAFLRATALLFPTDCDRTAAMKSIHKFFVDNGKVHNVTVLSHIRVVHDMNHCLYVTVTLSHQAKRPSTSTLL